MYEGRGSVKRVANDLMGKKVKCSAFYVKRKEWDANNQYIYRTRIKSNLIGWVTGVRCLPEGKWVNESHYEYAERYFQPRKTITVLLVATWPDKAPVAVPLDAFELTDEQPVSGRAWCDSAINRETRRLLSEDATLAPRDKKGRFI